MRGALTGVVQLESARGSKNGSNVAAHAVPTNAAINNLIEVLDAILRGDRDFVRSSSSEVATWNNSIDRGARDEYVAYLPFI